MEVYQSHDTLADRCDLTKHTDKSVGNGHSRSVKMPLRMAGQVVGEPTPTDSLDIRSSVLRATTLTPNRLSSVE